MPDPNSTHQGPSRHGGIAPTMGSAEFGTILSAQVDRYTYSVRTMRGRTLQGVPRMKAHPSDVSILPNGTTVIVRFDLGVPVIEGVLDMPAVIATTPGIPATNVEGYGGQGFNQTTNPNVGTYRGPNQPTDILPGDSIIAHPSGSRVGALEGGTAILAGSGAAQVQAHALDDLVAIISRNFKHVTDMGIYEIRNKDGRVNMSFRGASDQVNEAGADEEHWTVRMDLGSEGDLFNFELTTSQGQTLFRLHVDAAGRVLLYGQDGVIVQSGATSEEPHISEHAGDAVESTGGDRTETVGGALTETVQGDHASTVDGNATLSVGSDWLSQAARDVALSAGRNLGITANGQKDGTAAMKLRALGGGIDVEIGSPTYPAPGLHVKSYKGNLAFETAMGGHIKFEAPTGEINAKARKMIFDTSAPSSMILAGNYMAYHAMLFEPFQVLMKAICTAIDGHTHPANGSPPTTPVSPLLNALLTNVKSKRVGFGG